MTGDGPQPEWTEPGTFRVLPRIHRIPLPLPGDALRAVNVYAIEDGDGLVLIDSGWALAEARDRLERCLASLGAELGDIRRFLVTHIHRDHYTHAVMLRREFGTRVGLGRGEQPTLDAVSDPASPPFHAHLARLQACGAAPVIERLQAAADGGPADRSIWERPDEWLDGGTEIALRTRTLQVLATPGHTRGHLVFRDSQAGALFAGDHVLPHITPSIGFEAAPAALPLGDYLRSLHAVRALPDTELLPAHGPPADSVHARVDELVAHHDTRLAETLATVTAGAATAYESARALTWTRRGRAFDDLDPFNQMLAVNETAAHLDLLAAQERIGASANDGVTEYTLRD